MFHKSLVFRGICIVSKIFLLNISAHIQQKIQNSQTTKTQ